MSNTVVLPRTIADKMISHAREGKQGEIEEVCGLVAADQDGQPVDTLRVKNAADNKRIRYFMDPLDQHKAFMAMDYRNLELFAIYHSHPETEAYPSQTDRGQAFDPDNGEALYPDTYYLILSLADDENPRIRAFLLPDRDTVNEVPVEIV